MPKNVSAAILERVADPQERGMSPAAARSLLRLDFCASDHDRLAKLSEKAQSGKLTARQKLELDEYLRVSDLLALLQSKARRSLKRTGS